MIRAIGIRSRCALAWIQVPAERAKTLQFRKCNVAETVPFGCEYFEIMQNRRVKSLAQFR